MEHETVAHADAASPSQANATNRRSRGVVPRRLVMFRTFELPGVPMGRRAAALRLAVSEWSPYPDWSAAVAWLDAATAAVWLWNPEALPVARVRSWLPESLLLASDARPIEVNRTSEGWIVRRWAEGRLSAELFYGAMPSAAEWSSTMATLGVSDADSQAGWHLLTAAQPGSPLPKPWPERVERLDARAPVRTLDLRRLMLAGGGALVIATLVLGVISIRQWYVEGLLDRSLGEAKERFAPVAEQRSLAFDAVQRLQAWNELDRYPAPLELIDAFAESVPAGVVVSELRLDAGVIRATLSNPGIQPAAELVSRLQKSGRFTNIRVVPAADPRSLQVEMEVNRRAASPKAKHGA